MTVKLVSMQGKKMLESPLLIQIVCPVCNQTTCIQETVIEREPTDPPGESLWEKTTESFLCVGCGYTTQSSLFIKDGEDSDILVSARTNSPRIVQDLAFFDNVRKLVWFPTVMNLPTVGVLYPDGTVNEWNWIVAPYVLLSKNEMNAFAVNNENFNPKYEYRLGVECAVSFKRMDFKSALDSLRVLIMEKSK